VKQRQTESQDKQ